MVDHDACIYMYQDATPCKFVLCIMHQVTVLLVLSEAYCSRWHRYNFFDLGNCRGKEAAGTVYMGISLVINTPQKADGRENSFTHVLQRPLMVKLFLFSVTMSLNHGRLGNGVTEPCPPIGQGTAMVGPTSCHRRLSTLTP